MFFLSKIQYIGYDWMIAGLTKVLIIIAILQLVKKVPDLINTIFGTHIKTQGGIKGRLGEMAGIGALAQKAWTSLGTGAKNIGKALSAAPFAAAAFVANKKYKAAHDGNSFFDTEAFRRGKGALYAARSAAKTGSVMNAVAEYDKMSAPPQHTRDELARIRTNTLGRLDSANVTHNGIWTNEARDADGNIIHSNTTGKQEFKKRPQILNEIKATTGLAQKSFDNTKLGRELTTAINDGAQAKIKYNDILGVQKQGEKVVGAVDNINRMIQSGEKYTAAEKTTAQEIYDRLYNGDRIVTQTDSDFLKIYMNKTQADQFKTVVSRYDDAFQTALEGNSDLTVQDLVTSGALSGTLANAKAAVDRAKSVQDGIIDKMSDADKIRYNTFSEIIEQQTSALATTNAFNAAAPEDLLTDHTINLSNTSTAQTQGWANNASWAEDEDVGSGIKGAGSSTGGQRQTTTSGDLTGLHEKDESQQAIVEDQLMNRNNTSNEKSNYWRRATGDAVNSDGTGSQDE